MLKPDTYHLIRKPIVNHQEYMKGEREMEFFLNRKGNTLITVTT